MRFFMTVPTRKRITDLVNDEIQQAKKSHLDKICKRKEWRFVNPCNGFS